MAADIGFDAVGVFCFYIETTYEILINSIDTIIGIPMMLAAQIDSIITTAEYLVLDTISSTIIGVEKILLKLARKVGGIGSNNEDSLLDQGLELQKRVCEVAYSCAILQQFFESKGLSASDYKSFEDKVCTSFPTIIKEFISYITSYIQGVLDSAKLALKNWLHIDWLIQQWKNLIESIGLKALLAKIDEYAQCGFAACDAASSSVNMKENYFSKIGLDITNNNPFGDYMSDIRRQATAKQVALVAKVNNLNDILSNLDSLVP